jgi:membrane-associated phospholipid phosphatase
VLLSGAVAVGALRIAADKHWLSDNVMGHALGFGLGFGLPWLLHYQHRLQKDLFGAGPLANAALTLLPVENGGMLAATGTW